MTKLLWDSYNENYYLDSGVFRVDYIFDEDEGYHYEVYADGNAVQSVYTAAGVWDLDAAVQASLEEVEEFLDDLNKLKKMIHGLDRDKIRELSEIIVDPDNEEE